MKLATKHIAILCTLSTTAALGYATLTPAIADENSTVGIHSRADAPAYSAGTLAMKWGLKESFVNYVGGFTHVLDGAERDGNQVLWPAAADATVASDGTVTARFGGTVNFMKYCDDPDELTRGTCKLDFTAYDPKIEYNTVTNTGALYLTIHDYILEQGISGPGHWIGPEVMKFADLNGENSKFNSDNGVVTFEKISVLLTEDGAKTLPTYSAGLRIDDLSFSYAADSVRTGSVNEGFSVDTARTSLPYDDNTAVMGIANNAAVITTKVDDANKVAVINDKGEIIREAVEFDSGVRSPRAEINPAGDALYWNSNDRCSVRKIAVSTQGVGTAENVFTLPESECGTGSANGLILDYAFDRPNSTLGVLSLVKNGEDRSYKFRVLDESGAVTSEVALPSSAELYGTKPDEENYLEPYGSPYVFSATRQSLHGLGDGTFLVVYDHTVNKADGSTTGGVPVHITPAADVKASLVDVMAEQFYTKSHSYRNAAVGDGLIAVYNNNYGNHPSYQTPEDKLPLRVGTYSYADGTFKKKELKYLGNEWDQLSDIDVVDANTLFVVSANAQPKAGLFDASTLTLSGNSVGLADMKNLQNNAGGSAAAVGDSFIVLGQYEKDFEEFATISRLYKESGSRQPTAGVTPVRISGDTGSSTAPTTDNPPTSNPSSTSKSPEPKPSETPEPEASGSADGALNNPWVVLAGVAGLIAAIAAVIASFTHGVMPAFKFPH